MNAKKQRAIVVRAASPASFLLLATATTTTIIAIVVALAALLPAYLDDFLLTNDRFCYPSSSSSSSSLGGFDHRLVVVVDDDDDAEPRGRSDDRDYARRPSSRGGRRRRRAATSDPILRWISLRLWEMLSAGVGGGDPAAASAATTTTSTDARPPDDGRGESRDWNPTGGEDDGGRSSRTLLHPMCEGYRNLRSRVRFRELSIPWNWYYRTDVRVRGVQLRSSSARGGGGGAGPSPPRWSTMGWIAIHGGEEGWAVPPSTPPPAVDDDAEPLPRPSPESLPRSMLPPSLEIETVDITVRSAWSRPVVSAMLRGITVIVVVRKGEFPLVNHRGIDGTSLLFGDMTVREALEVLPRPPEAEGTYPRIGIVNITDVTLCVYENNGGDHNDNGGRPSLKLLLKMTVPDELFLVITDMTLAHERGGIDRKHFQPMVESSVAGALRRHLLREATAAFRNSWVSAHGAHEQLQQLLLQTQELFLDRWIEMGARAWRQGVVDGATPMVNAVEDWLVDIRDIISEPIPPLAVIVSHHWNRTVDGLNKHGISLDRQLWGRIDDLADKVIHFKREKAISNHLNDLKVAVDGFIAKSAQEIAMLVRSCELELKEMWLEWHRQFLPEL